jgi:hypothetical protein
MVNFYNLIIGIIDFKEFYIGFSLYQKQIDDENMLKRKTY